MLTLTFFLFFGGKARVCTASLRVIVDPGPPILHSISGKAEDNTYLFITRQEGESAEEAALR